MDRSIDVSSVIIVPTLDDIGRILQKHSTHVRAIVLMTNDGVDTMDDNHNGIPIIIGQQMRLPKDVEYSGEILIEVNTSIWSAQNQIILRGKNQHFLTPQFVPKQTIVKLRIPPEIDISKISTDM